MKKQERAGRSRERMQSLTVTLPRSLRVKMNQLSQIERRSLGQLTRIALEEFVAKRETAA